MSDQWYHPPGYDGDSGLSDEQRVQGAARISWGEVPRIAPTNEAITSGDLAQYVGQFVRDAQSRVLGVGAEQYDIPGQPQKFQQMPLGELCDWALEELQDVAVYAAMLAYRISIIKRELTA